MDRFTYDEESGKYVEKEGLAGNEATALIRMDGTGYLAAGNIRWDKKGKIDTNLGAFYFGDKLIDAYLNIFQLNEDSESGKLLDVTPLVPMTDIDVNHSVTIGGATLVWDAANKAIKVYDSKNGEPIASIPPAASLLSVSATSKGAAVAEEGSSSSFMGSTIWAACSTTPR